ncbi:MAG TPA: tyrosine--tRNA ligase [Smithellaceae bacterium]|nr:MAG: Tyrosine--tRNA ligase [Deltaproteobacteria bacterium ADurb.BinA014]HNQ19085.1 tyrosine--tRNA ligase [Smithellaceae bacterium]HNT91757.1 tyrosine--tRNA ligase [Smithellaceae bacterium]HNV65431.1 tyrosine--tRNA ligase [Smithellaceae bacterium]HOD31607.1 tyrosine--tRNA ligase [Smithellaceae bacterium]
MKNAYEILKERGFIEQVTDEALISGLFKNGPVTCYIGFDPTASSLHIGSLVPIMALSHMQKSDNKPIALVGGGTGLIGDPSGKTEMRQVLTEEQIQKNASCIGKQLSRYLDFYGGSKALLLNNAEWLTKVKYIEFLRDIGRHFSVNRMLAAESYKMRLEKGLNFIEFNYMILQAYDYLYLFKKYGCILQMGGNDQWGNMLAGTELIRKVTAKDAHAVTFPLITTSHGHKMGKTERGTIWLEGNLTSPYEYYQYWVNCDDADVERFLKLFTFLPLDEIVVVKKLVDVQLNMAKTVLAYEATKITHGVEAAQAAWRASAEAFHSRPVDSELFPSSDIPRNDVHSDISAIPRYRISKNDLERGLLITSTCAKAGLTQSMSEAKRLIEQGGIYVGNRQVKTVDEKILVSDFEGTKELRIRKGKKKYLVIELGN